MQKRTLVTQLVFAGVAFAAGRPTLAGLAEGASRPIAVVAPQSDSTNLTRMATVEVAGAQAARSSADAGKFLGRSGSELVAEYAREGWDSTTAPRAIERIVVAHTLVFVVPDPLDSHSDWAFDSELESMRRALESAGYVLDRYWLPWRPSSDAAQAAAMARDTLRNAVPGVMLFRHRDEQRPLAKDSVAIVYLVGEIPTSGIHAKAFAAAVRDRCKLATLRVVHGCTDARDTLRIVGPSFSGSARSLRNALNAAHAAALAGPASIVSGGATSRTNAGVLNDPAPDVGIAFHATVNTFDVLKSYVERMLTEQMGIDPREIAYLSESGTQFGLAGRLTQPGSSFKGSSDSAKAKAALDQLSTALQVPFPMNISRLRREYARNVLPGDTLGSAQASLTRIDWRDPASSAESPAPLSELSAPTIERTLADIEQTLTLHHIRAIGISATDVRDRLFLASIVKERLHDVLVFFVSSHALYLRPELNRKLRGSLVVSTYPLILENQFWDLRQQGRIRLAFTSEMAEGTYNAALAQLLRPELMTDYGFPMQHVGRSVPPVWITAIGANSLLPVIVDPVPIAQPASAGYALTRDALYARPAAEHTGGWEYYLQSILLALAMGGALTATLRWNLKALQPVHSVKAGADGRLEHVPAGLSSLIALAWHRESWVVLRAAAIGAAFAPIMLVLLRPQAHGAALSKWYFVLVGAGFLVSSIVVVLRFLVMRAAVIRGAGGSVLLAPLNGFTALMKSVAVRWKHDWLVHCGLHSLSFLYLAATGFFLLEVGTLLPPASNIFFLRALALDSGLSPVIPLLVGALILIAWCTWHLNRLQMLSEQPAFDVAFREIRPSAPQTAERTSTRSGMYAANSVTRIYRGLIETMPGDRAVVILVGMVLVVSWILLEFDRSLETMIFGPLVTVRGVVLVPGSFDLLFRFLMFSAIGFSTWTLYRLLTVSHGLRECLRDIEEMPLGSALGRLPSSLASSTRFTPFNSATSATVELKQLAMSRWHDLGILPMPNYAPVATLVKEIKLRTDGDSGKSEVAEPLCTLHMTLNEVAMSGHVPSVTPMRDDGDKMKPSTDDLWQNAAQDLVAIYVIDYVGWVVGHLRQLAFSLIGSLALTAIFLNSYPYEPEGLVQIFFFMLMAAAVSSVGFVLFQLNRDTTMSRISHTTPGEVSWDTSLVMNFAIVLAVPVLALLSSQFPQVGGFLFSWITPALKAIGKG